MYELLITGGEVIDPSSGIHSQMDIGISNGKIAALEVEIPKMKAARVTDARGKLVTPGLVDMHTHTAGGVVDSCVEPDEVGILSGVTTVCDAGSTGYRQFADFKRLTIPKARTDVFCFLHLCPIGLAVLPESWEDINPEATLTVIRENQDLIKGVKIRATSTLIENHGRKLVKTAKKLATEANIPLMVHIGIEPEAKTPEEKVVEFTRGLLSLLSKGDIITHIFTPNRGGVIQTDGTEFPELREAIKRGVVLDVANAIHNFSFGKAQKALDEGILPTTLSTDATKFNVNTAAVLSLAVTMSKFIALGLSLERVIEMTTINPARVLGEEHQRGSLGIGMPADISIMKLVEGEFDFFDNIEGKTPLHGKFLLVPEITVKSGVEIAAHSGFKY